MQALFHLAFHVRDLEVSRQFYTEVLGCTEGRSSDTWVDFSFVGIKYPCTLVNHSPLATRAAWVTSGCPCRTLA